MQPPSNLSAGSSLSRSPMRKGTSFGVNNVAIIVSITKMPVELRDGIVSRANSLPRLRTFAFLPFLSLNGPVRTWKMIHDRKGTRCDWEITRIVGESLDSDNPRYQLIGDGKGTIEIACKIDSRLTKS